mgnify:CR=1 FL=1
MHRERTSITFETKKEVAATLALLQLFEKLYNQVQPSNIDSELVEILCELNTELSVMKDIFFQ